jgi:Protein of unknown function (DUF3179)
MWDRQTQSWWQFDGGAIVGSLIGTRLTALDSQTLSFADFRARYPNGDALSRNTGYERPYGQTRMSATTPSRARGRLTTAGGWIRACHR